MTKDQGVYYIGGQTWNVGERYKIIKELGTGSFSSVCLALDRTTGEQIALKRIGDVLSSPDNARRVLREVCILRRVSHPSIIGLRDVFLRPSATGRLVYRGGRLVPTSLDVYIGMEYADRGDLYHFRGQMSELEVQAIMWQLLDAVRYLHALDVWHRDIKSANVLITTAPDGQRVVKLADLGSARSAVSEGYHTAEQRPTVLTDATAGGRASQGGEYLAMEVDDGRQQQLQRQNAEQEAVDVEQLYARPRKEGGGFRSPLTTLVCTPCYRAPEVVMSRGGYTSALDMWSCGCILGELLQRVAYLGKAATPHLSVAPVFSVQCAPVTPQEGDNFEAGGGPSVTHLELEALFRVIGTPAWTCIEAVQSPAWRHYLRRLKGRAPTLFRRFGVAGEPAVDLLARLLTFDPARRAKAEEAMYHEFFSSLAPILTPATTPTPEAPPSALQQAADIHMDDPNPESLTPIPASSSPNLSTPPRRPPDLAADSLADKLRVSMELVAEPPYSRPAGANAQASPSPPPEKRARPNNQPGGAPKAPAALSVPKNYSAPCLLAQDPARALAALEAKMAEACHGGNGTELLRTLLEDECAAQAVDMQKTESSQPTSPTNLLTLQSRNLTFSNWEHLQPDPAAEAAVAPAPKDAEKDKAEAESKTAKGRLPHHGDSMQAGLEPEQHLRHNRHTEWAPTKLGGTPRAGPAWGVDILPPGVSEKDLPPGMKEVISRQHKR